MAGDPVSWLMIEPGWRVVDASGEELGRVEAVTGDSAADIFDGLAVAGSIFAEPRYVPAEQIAGITTGQVKLAVDKAAFAQEQEYEIPAAEERISPQKASFAGRMEADVVHTNRQQHRPGLIRRVLDWFGLADRR
jgi:hypothetical protein